MKSNLGRVLFLVTVAMTWAACDLSDQVPEPEEAHDETFLLSEAGGDHDEDYATSNVALIPTMTGNTTPSGVVTQSGVYSPGYEAWQAFDATGTLWLSNMYTSSVWIGYEWGGGAAKTVNSYELKYNNGSCCQQRGPKNWTLQGWNGSTWVTVDTVTNQTGWYSNPNRTYTVDTPGAYSKYRLHVTADNYNDTTYPITLVSLSSLQLFGADTSCAPPPPGMIAWWTFDGMSSIPTTPDALGFHPAYAHNGPTIVPGKVFGALSLDGIDDYLRAPDQIVTSPDPDLLDFGVGDFSIAFWIKTSSTTFQAILGKAPGYRIYHASYGYIQLQLQDGDNSSWQFASSRRVNDGQWHHVAITVDRDASQGLAIYLDGALDSLHDPRPESKSLSNPFDLHFGVLSWYGSRNYYFAGALDELQMWKRVITPAEVQAIHGAGPAGVCLCRNC